jgi:hypothetical protein
LHLLQIPAYLDELGGCKKALEKGDSRTWVVRKGVGMPTEYAVEINK